MVMMHIVVTYAYIRICSHIYVTVYSVSHQLSIIGTQSQLSMEQKWCIFKQAHWFV